MVRVHHHGQSDSRETIFSSLVFVNMHTVLHSQRKHLLTNPEITIFFNIWFSLILLQRSCWICQLAGRSVKWLRSDSDGQIWSSRLMCTWTHIYRMCADFCISDILFEGVGEVYAQNISGVFWLTDLNFVPLSCSLH